MSERVGLVVEKPKDIHLRELRKCERCKIYFWPYKKELKKGWGRFCSVKCRNAYISQNSNPQRLPSELKNISYKRVNSNSKIKKLARENAGHKCAHCGVLQLSPRLHVHRILGSRLGGEYNLENVLVLCGSCHRKEHMRIGQEINRNRKEMVLPSRRILTSAPIQRSDALPLAQEKSLSSILRGCVTENNAWTGIESERLSRQLK